MWVQFDFLGGPKDGESVRANFGRRESGAVAAYYQMTNGGAPGGLLWCRTEYFLELSETLSLSALRDLRDQGSPLRGHLYRVLSGSQDFECHYIRVEHVGAFPDSRRASNSGIDRHLDTRLQNKTVEMPFDPRDKTFD